MKAIEFEAQIQNGKIEILSEYVDWFSQSVKVILLAHDEQTDTVQSSKSTQRTFFENIQLDLSNY